jgi:hypothetical protein
MLGLLTKLENKIRLRTPQLSTPFYQYMKKTRINSALINFMSSNNFYYLLLGFLVIAVSFVRWHLVPMPLERDEGEYAYFGHLILNGITPYREAYSMKIPGAHYMYALIMSLFGESYKGIHTGFLIMNAATMIMFFLAFKKLFNSMTGLLTAGFYGLMALSYHVLGFALHATHFIVFFLALSIYFFSRYEEKKSLLFATLSGAMLGMSFIMKQQAVYFILFGGILFVIFQFIEKPLKIRNVIINDLSFSFAVFIPYILVLLIMSASGTFDKFWFWTIKYSSKYVSGETWEQGKKLLSMEFFAISSENKWIWILALIGIVIVLFTKFSVKQKIFTTSFVVFSVLATTPGLYFREHYFIVVLPAVALLAGITLDFAGRLISDRFKIKAAGLAFPLVILTSLFIYTIAYNKFYYLTENPVALCKSLYGTNPFTESIEIANFIKANSSDTDKIAVLGSEPQIPFYANRKSATGYLYMYSLMEIHKYNKKMQEEMISEIENSKPLFLVYCKIPFSWLRMPNSPKNIFEWFNKYSTENYNVIGMVDIPDQGMSSFYWNADANRRPQNINSVQIFKRKE